MKKTYNLSGDIFIAAAFIILPVGILLKLLGIEALIWGITASGLIKLTGLSLLFSIALNLHDLAHA
ncbi:MAG: hypothetical protein ABH882_01070 [Candidatus Omnitrophota bacterium]|nr:hypothetical protein [Candidatus Omnitrophota bacterium]MBU1929491.1 hypothetical protein [Candidatus Omnitrophota bacterium]MBU2034952.1 hypothetical protein [Candidatus Omnitrophota bacterium]MBU2221713.1 hypothetical protein [Candidatus Omnitrophota bacterium]MBU2258895.1 hypothetical protein [Candidatus Omnitrophota bacterium]